MSAWEVEIVDTASNQPIGFGPIITGQFFDSEAKLDSAGAVSFDMPRADPKSDLVAERQTVRCATLRGGQWVTVASGVVEDLTEDMQPDQVALLEVGASDSLIALADRTVGNLPLSSGAGGKDPMAAASLLGAIMAFAPAGWTVVGTPSEDVYLALNGESVLAALGKLASQLGDHFRLDSNLTLTWLSKTTAPVASGLRAMGNIPNPTALSSDTCLITHLSRKRDASKQASRVEAFGGGNNDARVTLKNATYTLPAGYSYEDEVTSSGHRYWIKHNVADAANRIDAIQTFQDVAAASTAAGHALSATNALAQTAATWLGRHVDVYYSYDLEVTGVSQAVLPGQTIRVVHDQYLAGRRIAVVDADLLVLGVKKRLDAEGTARIVSLTVANSDRWPEDDDHLVAGTALRTQSQSAHLQVASRSLTADTVSDTDVAHLSTTQTWTGINVYTPALAGSGAAAIFTFPTTSGGGTQYGIKAGGDGTGAANFFPIGVFDGGSSWPNMRASIWIGSEAGRPGLSVGYGSGVDAPDRGALILGNVGIGNLADISNVPAAQLHVVARTTAAADVTTALIVSRSSSGAGIAGYGAQALYRLKSSTTVGREATDLTWSWATATDASRKARAVLSVWDTAQREVLRGEASGSAAMIGVLGAAASVRQTVTGSRSANAALASLLTALATFGWITDSSTI